MNLWKIVQKQFYDVLSNKYSMLLLFLISASVIVTAFQFGETWMEWSRDKYSSMFNQFSDNIGGKSLQNILCQSVPIDIVYTWVNGTDPVLLSQLQQIQQKVQHGEAPTRCFYRNCVPSQFLSISGELGVNVKSQLEEASDVTLITLGNKNWTLISFLSSEAAKAAQNKLQLLVAHMNYTVHHAHWTTDFSVTNSVAMSQFISILGVHSGLDKAGVVKSLPWSLQAQEVWLYLDHGLAVAQLLVPLSANVLAKTYSNITIDGKEAIISTNHLILQMPNVRNPEDFSASRFEDKEELRYSLRSIEKYAPWVRHVFLVTNGQIPYWLNLDHPRMTVIPHEEIFQNSSHLPTFSSPAIESHLHRIPGLSTRFLYLNDDVMFGKEVWPEDFFTEAKGQKIYLSWPVPECHEGCPSSWIGDGYCDRACNKSDCMWDGGDCRGDSTVTRAGDADSILVPDSDGEGIEPWPGAADDPASCASNCADSWLADKYCDANCNVLECGFDAGDCGTSKYHKMHELKFNPNTLLYNIPDGILMAYWNVSRLLASSIITAGEFDDASVVRTWALCLKFQVLTLVLRPGFNATVLQGALRGSRLGHRVEIKFKVAVNTSKPMSFGSTPKYLHNIHQDLIGISTSAIPFLPFTGFLEDIVQKPQIVLDKVDLKPQVSNDVKLKIIQLKQNVSKLSNSILHPSLRKTLEFMPGIADDIGFLPWEKNTLNIIAEKKILGRKLLDTFGESLLHVNQLYNREFGFEARRVPAHMAHLMDRSILNKIQERFPKEWDATSSHKIRNPLDMQYAFSYFYFLMNEKENITAKEIFDSFDTDNSGTWSDREIRTVLTRMHDLPLNLATVSTFENLIINCSNRLPKHLHMDIVTPPYERYVDSKMPVVSRDLVIQCKEITTALTRKFGTRKKYKYEVIGEDEVTFKMLSSNLSQVISCLDEVRRKPRKFICLNDNLDPSREKDNALVKAVLQDFYESVLPIPSSFELPYIYRNRFLHVSELHAWRRYRAVIHSATLVCIILLAVLSIILICQGEGRPWYKRLYKRIRSSGCVNHV